MGILMAPVAGAHLGPHRSWEGQGWKDQGGTQVSSQYGDPMAHNFNYSKLNYF